MLSIHGLARLIRLLETSKPMTAYRICCTRNLLHARKFKRKLNFLSSKDERFRLFVEYLLQLLIINKWIK